jgi:hypothetical protein
MRRIAALHAEVDEIVARHVDAVAKECGFAVSFAPRRSLPRGSVQKVSNLILNMNRPRPKLCAHYIVPAFLASHCDEG